MKIFLVLKHKIIPAIFTWILRMWENWSILRMWENWSILRIWENWLISKIRFEPDLGGGCGHKIFRMIDRWWRHHQLPEVDRIFESYLKFIKRARIWGMTWWRHNTKLMTSSIFKTSLEFKNMLESREWPDEVITQIDDVINFRKLIKIKKMC